MILVDLFPSLRCWLVMTCCMSLIACTTLTPIELHQASKQLAVGDKVELMTVAGKKLTFKLDNIDDMRISGEGHTLAYSDISTLSKVSIDGTKTTLLIIGVVAVAAAAGGGGGGGGGSY